jgi:hypothetical protein
MAINWLILRTKRSLSLLLLLGDFKHAERGRRRREGGFVPAFWVDAPRAFAAAAVRVVRLFFFLRGAICRALLCVVIQLFEKEEKDLQF